MSAATAPSISMRRPATHSRRFSRPLAVAGALAATLGVWLVARLAGVDLTVRSGAVSPASVALATIVAGAAACGLLAALDRVARRPGVAWTTIALIALVVSLAGPLALGETATAKVALTCMHLAAAAILIPALRPRRRRGHDAR